MGAALQELRDPVVIPDDWLPAQSGLAASHPAAAIGVAVLLLLLATFMLGAMSGSDPFPMAGGVIGVWAVLLGWCLWAWRNTYPSPFYLAVGIAGGVTLLAEGVLFLTAPNLFMLANFVSLHIWSACCALGLCLYACFVRRPERRSAAICGLLLLVIALILPLASMSRVAQVVGIALGIVPALGVAGWLLLRTLRHYRATHRSPILMAIEQPAWNRETPSMHYQPAAAHWTGWSKRLAQWDAGGYPHAAV
jgi:hypothetical protein